MRKYFFQFIAVPLISAISVIPVKAYDNNQHPLFNQMINNGYLGKEKLIIKTKDNTIITNTFMQEHLNDWKSQNYETIFNDVNNKNYSVSSVTLNSIPMKALPNEITPFSTWEIKSYTFKQHEKRTDKISKKYVKEWDSVLKCTFSYNGNTYKVGTVYDPQFSVMNDFWGSVFTAIPTNISTWKNKYSTYATFGVSYTMKGKISGIINMDFGDIVMERKLKV